MTFLSRNHVLLISLIVMGIFLGWYLDIKLQMAELQKMRIARNELILAIGRDIAFIKAAEKMKSQLLKVKKSMRGYLRLDDKSAVKAELLTAILQAGELNGLVIQALDSSVWRSIADVDALSVHVVASGKFSQFHSFLEQLFLYSLPFMMTDFSLQVEQDGLIQMDMHLVGFFVATSEFDGASLVGWRHQNKISLPSVKLDPFSVRGSGVELTNVDNEPNSFLDSVSFGQMKFVGYMRENLRSVALVMLPNGKTLEILCGLSLGLEKVKVVDISEKGVMILMEGKERLVRYSV